MRGNPLGMIAGIAAATGVSLDLYKKDLSLRVQRGQTEEQQPKTTKQGVYYSPTSGRHFNMKMIRRICKKFNLSYKLDEELGTVWFEENKDE